LSCCRRDLRIEDAEDKSNEQHKFFTEFSYTLKQGPHSEMRLGLGGDVTLASRNIGKDWTAYAQFDLSF